MSKSQYKKFISRFRKIKNSKYVGTHGYYSDLVSEFNVSMEFIREISRLKEPVGRLVYGRYTTEYQENQRYAAAMDSYYERLVGA
jgi:hypothetical protein